MSDTCCEGCNRPDLPWAGRGTDLPISGCRFTLYPMCDNFIDIILGGLECVDTSAVWSETDALSTVYRGKLDYVMDAVSALFASAWTEGVHMAIEGQVSKGCPGDVSGDSKLTYEGEAPNRAIVEAATQPCLCKLALYPMGVGDYIDDIARVWRMAEDRGLNPQTIHYATRIEGSIHDVFAYLTDVCKLMEASESVHHYVLHFTINVNSPTVE
ncbi:putative HMP/thiamine-binding protein YkoF [Parolsenella catena]|uniref:Putative HMP/thiamine-binding protein YkoF n=1 Tax=Parolsenella catena TaxID=2003188 RepID=A0A3G9K0T7_9ACTN|nr:YkoF family thiamine/hydroxymethylpyrimidine-binding protein [Parolsenella catena]BBH49796.1 putative HMP/thiamine-binding protein YkoF [Parolsenella catena]